MTEETSIDAAAFASAVRWAARALPAKAPMPALGGIVLEAGSGVLTVSAYDFIASAGALAQCSGDLGTVVVSGRMLADIAGRLTGNVKLINDGLSSVVTIRAGRDKFRLPLMQHDEYPSVPAPPDPDGTAPGFADAVTRVEVAASADMSRPILTGIELTAEAGALRLAATDTYRAAIETIAWDGPDLGPVIVPAKRLKDLAKDAGDKPSIGFGKSVLSITAGHQTAAIAYLDGELPKLNQMLFQHGSKSTSNAQADRAELMRAVSTSGLFASQARPVKLDFAPGSITAFAEDDGSGELVIEAQYDGPERRLALDPRFLADALAAAAGPVVQLRLPPGESGGVLVDSLADYGAEPDPGHQHVVMSLRIL